MARSSWRQRSDGVYQIVGNGRRVPRKPLALASLLVAFAMYVAAVSAVAVYLVILFPFLVAGAALLLVRRAGRHSARPGTSSAVVLTMARRKPSVAVAARDAGA